MTRALVYQIVPLVLFLVLPGHSAGSADGENKPESKPRPALAVWDTGKESDQPLAPTDLAGKAGWTQVSVNETLAAFKGDAVMTNGRVLAVVRKRGTAVEVYADGAADRFQLLLVSPEGDPAARQDHVSLVENTKGAAALEVSYQTAKKAAVTANFRVKKGDTSLETQPGAGAGRLRVECPVRFVVLPDFFADDILVDARKITRPSVEVPSENFLLHMRGNGAGIAMCVFENRQQDVKVALAGEGEARTVTSSEIGFEGKKIWVAVLDGPHIWHTRQLETEETGKVLPLDWKMPFVAQWRVDFTRTNDLTDSWEMLLENKKDGGYIKPSWLGGGEDYLDANRGRWNTVLGWYPYPCWSDHAGQGFLQPVKHKALTFGGPVVVYPINRVEETPLDAYTVVDVMRNTLGVGPCEHILDLEGQKAEYKGRATCAVRDSLCPIYEKNEQKAKHAEVEKILDDGLIFVKHIRGRITRYADFGKKMRIYLADQKKAHPELSEPLDELDNLVQEIDMRVAARADKIHTPAYVAQMNEDFRKNVLDYEGPDALQRCKKYTRALVEIGDNQDELSAECRWVVKTLRQRAATMLAADPRLAEVAAEIRARTQEALRNPANHEGARH
jgi:hypothetical protein